MGFPEDTGIPVKDINKDVPKKDSIICRFVNWWYTKYFFFPNGFFVMIGYLVVRPFIIMADPFFILVDVGAWIIFSGFTVIGGYHLKYGKYK